MVDYDWGCSIVLKNISNNGYGSNRSFTNLKEIKNMGYKPFVVGFISMATVGLVSITTIELYLNFFN